MTIFAQTPEASRESFVPYDNQLLLKLRTRARRVAKRAGLIDVEAEDVAQNALLALVQTWNVQSPAAWITTVALRGAHQVIRHRIRNNELTERVQTEYEFLQNRDKRRDVMPDLTHALRYLGPIEREVFITQELNLCTWPELSCQTGLSIPTLRRRLKRAHRLIRRAHNLS